jgi:hypothetical protein
MQLSGTTSGKVNPLVQPIRPALRHGQARTLCFSAAAAVAAVLMGCTASPSSAGRGGSLTAAVAANIRSASQSANVQDTLAYSRCMRSHGVPGFPDADGSGQLPKETAQQLGVSDARLQTAQEACKALWPIQPTNRAKPQPSGSDTQNQPPQTKQATTGSGAQTKPPEAKPKPEAGQ